MRPTMQWSSNDSALNNRPPFYTPTLTKNKAHNMVNYEHRSSIIINIVLTSIVVILCNCAKELLDWMAFHKELRCNVTCNKQSNIQLHLKGHYDHRPKDDTLAVYETDCIAWVTRNCYSNNNELLD